MKEEGNEFNELCCIYTIKSSAPLKIMFRENFTFTERF